VAALIVHLRLRRGGAPAWPSWSRVPALPCICAPSGGRSASLS